MKNRTLDFKLILPKTIDNRYRGLAPAKYFFYLVVLFTIARSLIHIFAADGGAQSIATIPLDTFSPANAADTVIYLFAVWGLSQLLMGFVYLLAALRWRSLIPLMYVLVALEYALRLTIGHAKPIETLGTAPGEIGNYVLVPAAVLMLILSIIRKKDETAAR